MVTVEGPWARPGPARSALRRAPEGLTGALAERDGAISRYSKAIDLDLRRVKGPQKAQDSPGWELEKVGSTIKAGSHMGIGLQDAVNL